MSVAPDGALPSAGASALGAHEDSHARGLQAAAHHPRHRVEPGGERALARETLLDLEQRGEPAGAGPALIAEQSRDHADGRRQ